METIKDVWYAVVWDNKIDSVYKSRAEASEVAEKYIDGSVERVQVVITRIVSK